REYLALKELFEEIVTLAGRRITRMRRLLVVLRRPEDEMVKRRLKEYDKSQMEWNDRLNSFYARLKLYLEGYEMVQRLEEEIQSSFVSVGHQLELAVRER